MLEEVIWCCRDGVTTRCNVYLSYHEMALAVGTSNIPQYIKDINANMSYSQSVRWGVDIESVDDGAKFGIGGVEIWCLALE